MEQNTSENGKKIENRAKVLCSVPSEDLTLGIGFLVSQKATESSDTPVVVFTQVVSKGVSMMDTGRLLMWMAQLLKGFGIIIGGMAKEYLKTKKVWKPNNTG